MATSSSQASEKKERYRLSVLPETFRGFFRLGNRRRNASKDSLDVVIDPKAPGKVKMRNGETMQFELEPGPDGDFLQFARRSTSSDKAAVKIQAAFRRYKARELFESLQALSKMNLEIKCPDSVPFIGLLVVCVHNIKDLSGVRTALLRTKFDGDTSIPIPGHKDHNHVINYDHRATFVNIALRSNSVFIIEVLQSFEMAVRLLGKIHIPLPTIPQKIEERSIDIRSPSGDVVGVMNMTVGYQWLRDTADYGGYAGPEIVVMQQRKFRGSRPVERLWKVNHWVCSHDNVWSVNPRFADVVKEAIRHERNKSSNIVVFGEDGRRLNRDFVPTGLRFKEAAESSHFRMDLATSELLQQCTGISEWTTLEPFDSVSSVSTNVPANLGSEDWRSLVNSFLESNRSDATSSSIVEEEVNYDYRQPSAELIEQEMSDESSDSGTVTPRSPSLDTQEEVQSPKKKHWIGNCKSKREPLSKPNITGKFEYGAYRPASKRGVHIFARKVYNSSQTFTGANVIYMGQYQTSKRGRLEQPMPPSVASSPGLYNIMALLPDDNTFGHGSMYLLEKGSKCVVFDLDGTITTSDVHVVAQTLLGSVSASTVIGSSLGRNYDLRARPNALTCVRAWAAKGYQVVYLSGRQGSAYNMTLEWLIKHGYPPGPIHLTRTHLPTLPVYVSVGHFKIKYMEELKSKGLEIYAAYGNTGTDIRAYENVGIPKERTFIVGTHGGKKNTQAVKDFTSHLPYILLHPDSDKPLPYTELLRPTPMTD